MSIASPNKTLQATPVFALLLFLSQLPGAPEFFRWAEKHESVAGVSCEGMPKHEPLPLWIAALLALAGCATDSEPRQVRALRRETSWPETRSIAEGEVAWQRQDPEFAHRAFYSPESHRNGVWRVVVSSVQRQGAYYSFAPGGLYGGYPGNMWQDVIVMSVKDGGEVASYSTYSERVPRLP